MRDVDIICGVSYNTVVKSLTTTSMVDCESKDTILFAVVAVGEAAISSFIDFHLQKKPNRIANIEQHLTM